MLAGLGLASLAVARSSKHAFERDVQRRVGNLVADAAPQHGARFTSEDVADVPAPVRRYAERVLDDGQPYVRRGQLHQDGEFRLGDAWHPLTATEWFSTQPPGFVWDATIDVMPLLPVRVIDSYQDAEGALEARLRSTLPVMRAGPSPEMSQGELVRYLAEAVWYPTALLPTQGVSWEAVDDESAQATLKDPHVTATVVFHFDDADRVTAVTTERYHQEDGSFARWRGTFDDYEEHNGLEIPTTAAVAWESEDEPYWRGDLRSIQHVVANDDHER